MRVLILGGDGYLGWPTAMAFASAGHEVWAADNYLRRVLCLQTRSEPLFPTPSLQERADIFKSITGFGIKTIIGDLRDCGLMERIFREFDPEAVVHYAEQPSAPYSMMDYQEARLTLLNNLEVTLNLIWATIRNAPDCHIIKLGTMGEYGTPNIDIEEGWIEIEHKGRKHTFLYPRQASSLYHTTKIQDTDLLWFYCRTNGLRVTDLMQGPVYGLTTAESELDERLQPFFNYDDIFGTVVNRFLVQAAAEVPLTVYGKGGQTRGYINLMDTIQCVQLCAEDPVKRGQLRILNQFTETFSVNELAEMVQRVGSQLGLSPSVGHVKNPRLEAEEHYYNPVHTGLIELGLNPHNLTDDVLTDMLSKVLKHKDGIDPGIIRPRVRWH